MEATRRTLLIAVQPQTCAELFDAWKKQLANIPGAFEPIIGWPAIYLACYKLGLTRWGDKNYTASWWRRILKRSHPCPVMRLKGRHAPMMTTYGVLVAWALSGLYHASVQRRRR